RRVVTLGPSQVSIENGDQASATMEANPEAQSSTGAASSGALPPVQTLDGYGQLGSPPLRAVPIAPDKLDTTSPGPDHPPGYYGPSGAGRAFHMVTTKTGLKATPKVRGADDKAGYK